VALERLRGHTKKTSLVAPSTHLSREMFARGAFLLQKFLSLHSFCILFVLPWLNFNYTGVYLVACASLTLRAWHMAWATIDLAEAMSC